MADIYYLETQCSALGRSISSMSSIKGTCVDPSILDISPLTAWKGLSPGEKGPIVPTRITKYAKHG